MHRTTASLEPLLEQIEDSKVYCFAKINIHLSHFLVQVFSSYSLTGLLF